MANARTFEGYSGVLNPKKINMSLKTWFRTQIKKWKQDLESLVRQTHVMILVLKHPGVPWYARLVAGLSVSYIFSPIQLIPTFIPLIGQLDDLLILFVGMKLLRRITPALVLEECEAEHKYRLSPNCSRADATVNSANEEDRGLIEEVNARSIGGGRFQLISFLLATYLFILVSPYFSAIIPIRIS
jgi:uncharacterized membrane protein YkvA (DUF1232 family)